MIAFTDQQWDRVSSAWMRWWAGELERPIVCAQLLGRFAPDGPTPIAPALSQANCLDFSIPAEALMQRAAYELTQVEFLGDAFPYVSFTAFGPGVVAAFLGGAMDNSSGAVWFGRPAGNPSLEELQPRFNPDHPVARRIVELYQAGKRLWGDQVLMGYPDLGGVLDVLASLRGSESLLMDLYDQPEEVERVARAIAKCWWEALSFFHEALEGTRGYSAWLSAYAPGINYTTQCDFCYMISPTMFDRFVYPTLSQDWVLLQPAIYHLDGVGELPHLPRMLSDPNLDAIQWVPGDGKPDETHWPEVYQAIAGAGKRIVCNDLMALPVIAAQTGAPSQIAATNNNTFSPERWEAARAIVSEYGGGGTC